MSLFSGTSAWIVPASSSIFPSRIFTATPNRWRASLIFLSMYACSSGVYLTRFRGSLKYRRAARAWNGVCTGYFQFAGSAYLFGSFGYPCGGPRRPSLLRPGLTARTIDCRNHQGGPKRFLPRVSALGETHAGWALARPAFDAYRKDARRAMTVSTTRAANPATPEAASAQERVRGCGHQDSRRRTPIQKSQSSLQR